ncbi:MAG: DUF3500 domain-containing protein [Chthonomonadales bacterium]|nr:DUF3500 domain-containing protein [Chthonomonadales bacterium]
MPYTLAAVLALMVAARTTRDAAPDPVVAAAQAFLGGLAAEQRGRALMAFDAPERLTWSYLPGPRPGLPRSEMTAAQIERLRSLLRTALSPRGLRTVDAIRSLEAVLRDMEGNAQRDPERYYIALFGAPSVAAPWAWRYEGHHVSLSFTVVDGRIAASTPQFLGANPAEVPSGPTRGLRALAPLEDMARALLASLDDAQRRRALLDGPAPADIVTGMQRKAAIQSDSGLPYTSMRADQRGLLLSLIGEHAAAQRDATARARLKAIRAAGLNHLVFAWMGGERKGEGHYYRIQGPTFLVEYDNTQNRANHVHTVWRDFRGDWGEDVLIEHYREGHGAGAAK